MHTAWGELTLVSVVRCMQVIISCADADVYIWWCWCGQPLGQQCDGPCGPSLLLGASAPWRPLQEDISLDSGTPGSPISPLSPSTPVAQTSQSLVSGFTSQDHPRRCRQICGAPGNWWPGPGTPSLLWHIAQPWRGGVHWVRPSPPVQEESVSHHQRLQPLPFYI